MSFIPNYPDATYLDQAEPDSVDFEIILGAIEGTGVASGGEVTAAPTGNLTVAVSLGHVIISNQFYTVTAGDVNLSALPDATYNRFVLITVGTNGTPTYAAGPISNNPRFPSIPANSAVLAAVYLPAGTTDIQQTQIVDKRIFIHQPVPRVSALPTADSNLRGKLLRVEGGAGVADSLYLCIKNIGDTYEWSEIV